MFPLKCKSLKLLVPIDFDQLHFKDENRVARNLWRSTRFTITEMGGDGELPLFSLAHSQKSLVPSLDDLSHADSEFEWITTRNRRVELSAILKFTRVMHLELVSLPGLDGAFFSGNPLFDADLEFGHFGIASESRTDRQGRQRKYHQNGPHLQTILVLLLYLRNVCFSNPVAKLWRWLVSWRCRRGSSLRKTIT